MLTQINIYVDLSNITTRIPDDDEELCSLVITLQYHQCSAYCCRKGGKCCFGFPKVPSSQTLIGQQLADDKLNQKELMKIAQEILRELGEQM